jgi:hypothetical protein
MRFYGQKFFLSGLNLVADTREYVYKTSAP